MTEITDLDEAIIHLEKEMVKIPKWYQFIEKYRKERALPIIIWGLDFLYKKKFGHK